MLSIFDDRRRGLTLGATSYSRKVEGREVLAEVFSRVEQAAANHSREILVVNAGPALRRDIENIASLEGVTITYAESAVGALERFTSQNGCVIVGVGQSEASAANVLVDLQKATDRELELIAYTPEGSAPQDLSLVPFREGTIVRDVNSVDRLLREVTRMLHIPESSLPERERLKLEKLRQSDHELIGSKVLIVDDDVRNIFALTSILERHQIEVVHAENGRAGIELLAQSPEIDIVLMDIMMPGMDGYETIRSIREVDALRDLPIIAVTAKAMKGDREKCIESGASDYIAKPVDLDQLFSLMRVWTHDRRHKKATTGASMSV
jgi:CheY-like chemotaxis protein